LQLLELVQDQTWLVKVTNAVNQHWQKNNSAKKNSHASPVCVSLAGAE
jgi:hypothetical protein